MTEKSVVMDIAKYLSLEEARKKGQLKRFAKEHASKADERFWPTLDAIVTGKKSKQETSVQACPDNCNETQTPSDICKDDF